jgi:deoxyribonuclease V
VILAVDVQYQDNKAFVGGVVFGNWASQDPIAEYVSTLHDIEEYEPGNFYKRELPCILKLLAEHELSPACIVIDGYVYLDGEQKPGLGKRLFDSLANLDEVIGVAKKAFSGIGDDYEIYRGKSGKPLYITTTGDLELAKSKITRMFGKHRIPVLLKCADKLCREAANKCLQRT